MADYKELARAVDLGQRELAKAAPGTMEAFSGFFLKASEEGALGKKHKELIALAIAVATKCEGCIAIHARAVARHGANEAEVADALMVAVEMSGGPGVVYSGKALEAFRAFS